MPRGPSDPHDAPRRAGVLAGRQGREPDATPVEVARFGTDVEWQPETTDGGGGRSGGGRGIRFAAVASAIVLVVFLVGVVRLSTRAASIERAEVAGLDESAEGGAVNWLLVGTDSREGIDPDGGDADVFLGEPVFGVRTDTIMVARVDDSAGAVDLLSVPRDLWVPIAGRGESGRINGAFNGEGGRDRLVATVEAELGIELNRYVEIDFVGFAALIDSMGGVPICFDGPTRDLGSGLDIAEAGCPVLDGGQALAYARSRQLETLGPDGWRTDPTGDLGRTERQRHLMGRLVEVGGDIGVADLLTIDRVSSQAADSVTLGGATGFGDLIAMARTVRAAGSDRIVGHALPVEAFTTSGGAQVLRLRSGEAQIVLDRFRPAPGPASPETGG